MTRQELLNRVEAFIDKHGFSPVAVRMNKDSNYGLDKQTYSLWLVGPSSADDTLVMGVDTYYLERFRSRERAIESRGKLNRFLGSTGKRIVG